MVAVSDFVRGRRGLSRRVIVFSPTIVEPPVEVAEAQHDGVLLGAALRGVAGALAHRWPAGLAPTPVDDPGVDPAAPLPPADYVVIAWTVAEARALANVFTPGINPARRWHSYTHNYEVLLPTIRAGAPARGSNRLASWYRAAIGVKTILVMKSELHLNQNSISTGDGTATLPVAELFRQIIGEAQPRLVITTGTAGGSLAVAELGDVVITRAARFRLADEFRKEPFNGLLYKSMGEIPTTQLGAASALLDAATARLKEPDFGPPITRYPFGALLPGFANTPRLLCNGKDFAEYLPILTTDTLSSVPAPTIWGTRGVG